MKRALALLCSISIVALGCGETTLDGTSDSPSAHPAWAKTGTSQQSLQLTPRIELTGVGDVFDAVELTEIAFNAEMFVLPETLEDGIIGDAVPLRYDFTDGAAQSVAVERDLVLPNPGKYRVLLRVEPADNGVSLNVAGAFGAPEVAAREKGGEPAPTTAEPAPTTAEPAPTTADDPDEEPAPTTAEPAPTTAEPAPTVADEIEGDGEPVNEPAPTTADGVDGEGSTPSSEPAPTTAEPAPTTARGKGDTFDPGTTEEAGQRLFYSSREAFEFYAGVVTVTAESRELVVTWDIRPWLRVVLSEPLGIPATELDVNTTGGPSVGFRGATKNFKIVTR